MTHALNALQAAVVSAVQAHPVLAARLTGIYDGPPPRAAFPYVSMGDSLVSDWSTKTAKGREIRLALTLWDSGECPSQLTDLMANLEEAMAALPRNLPGWRIASLMFQRSMVVRDSAGPWAGLLEHRIRLLAE